MSRSSRPYVAALRRRSTPSPRSRHRVARRSAALAAAGLVAVLAPVATAGPAAAHDSLTGSSPSDGATVTSAPERVRLTFSEQVEDIGLTVLVKDPSGTSVADGAPTIDGRAVVQPLGVLEASGVYTVAYRVVSSDGHPISGRFTFAVELPSPSPSVSPSPSSSASASASTSAPTPSASSIAASPAASTSGEAGATAWLVAGAGLLAVLVVVGVVLARRRSA